MKTVCIGVPTVSYGRDLIRDILKALDGCTYNALNINTRNLTMYIDGVDIVNIKLATYTEENKFIGTHADFVWGFDTQTTLYLTDNQQTKPCFSFSGLIDYLRSVLDQN